MNSIVHRVNPAVAGAADKMQPARSRRNGRNRT